jgi:tetratricopeptide (TPR) repeat protein
MARKLSRVACCVRIVAGAAALSPAAVFAQSSVQVAPPAQHVVNPFSAKRLPAAERQAAAPATVAPIDSAGPKTYQNPFARGEQSPRFLTPRLQPGPMSRWHRSEQSSPPPQVDQRPIQETASGPEAEIAKGDLSGPLARQQRRSALFALPGGDKPIDWANPPDPSSFGRKELNQPTWLLPHESQVTTANAKAAANYALERATQHEIDPFDEQNAVQVVISDDGPPVAKTPLVEETAAAIEEAPSVESVAAADAPALPISVDEGPELQLPTADTTVVVPPEVPVPLVKELVKPPAKPPARGADDWYADAEKAAARATGINELAAVVQLCRRGIASRPDPELAASLRTLAAWACNRSGEIESDQRREDEALKAFELAIQWDPSCWLALHNRAVSRAQQGDLEGALADFNRAIHLNPGLAVAFRNRGELLAAIGRTDEAIADYTMALSQLPQDTELLTMRGESYHRLGDYENAMADLSQAIEVSPHDAAALAQRGNVQAELGEFQRAIADFQRALAADTNSAEAHRSLAWLLATCPDERFRNPRQALAAAEAAAKLAAPGDPFVLDALAAANANAGRFERAVHIQQEAIINVPEDFAGPFQERLAMYGAGQPFRNGTTKPVDENVRAASLETDSATQR